MTNPNEKFDFQALVMNWLDGTATDSEKEFLAQQLKKNPDLEKDFLITSRIHSQLNSHFNSEMKLNELKERLSITLQDDTQTINLQNNIFKYIDIQENKIKKSHSKKILSLVAIIILSFSLLFIVLTQQYIDRPSYLAKIDDIEGDFHLLRQNKNISLSKQLKLDIDDQIKTSEGQSCTIIYEDQTKVEIYENTSITLMKKGEAKLLVLEQGKIKGTVLPQTLNAPMLIKTPHTLSTVLGTIFEIDTHLQNTKLTVLKGKVAIKRLIDSASIIVTKKKYVDVFENNTLQLQTYRSFNSTLHQDAIRLIKIDFGTEDSQTLRWNNVFKDMNRNESKLSKLIDTNTYIENLTDSKLRTTGIRLNISETINRKNSSGYQNEDEQGYPRKATIDSIWGSDLDDGVIANPTIKLSLSNLNPQTPYSFTFYGSVMTAKFNLETEFQVHGEQSESVLLNVAHNKDKSSSTSQIFPQKDGTIDILVKKGQNNTHPKGHYFLGAMVISIFDQQK